MIKQSMMMMGVVGLVLLACACGDGKGGGEDCTSNEECMSDCCYPAEGLHPFCSSGDTCMSSGFSSGDGTSPSGACAFYDARLNRVLCEQRSSSSSCSGKFFGAGTTCHGLSCTSGSDPHSCTIGGGGG